MVKCGALFRETLLDKLKKNTAPIHIKSLALQTLAYDEFLGAHGAALLSLDAEYGVN